MSDYIIADNQFITSEGISILLERDPDVKVIVRAATVQELQEKLKLHPDAVVILDYTLFDFDSMEQMLIVKAAAPGSSWIFFSDELGEYFLRQVLVTDPEISIVMKQDSREQITEALKSAANGISYICETAEQIIHSNAPGNTKPVPDKLTPQEKVILHEIASGKTTKEIAYEKNLSFHTVNSHRKNIFRKLGINNMHEAVKYAIRAGILDVADYYI